MSRFAYRVQDGRAEAVDPAQCAVPDSGFVWVHLDRQDSGDVAWVVERAGVDRLTAAALVATETRPRTEAAGAGVLVNLRGRSSAEMRLSDPLASLRLHATRGRVISVSRLPLVAVPPVRAKLEGGGITDPGDLIAALAAAITADLDPEVGALGDALDDCEERIDGRNSIELRRDVARSRATAIGYRRFVAPQRLALERLADAEVDWLDDADRRHLREAADRAARMAEELESIRERAALIHETLTDLRAETIDARSLLIAIVAMVFLPLTFITGLFGMNVEGIPYADHPWSFWTVTGLCLAVAGAVSAFFVRERWTR